MQGVEPRHFLIHKFKAKGVKLWKRTKKTTTEELGFFKKYGFYLALAVLAVIVMLPNPEGLSVAGQRMIGIMVFFGHSLGDNGDLVPGQRRRHYGR